MNANKLADELDRLHEKLYLHWNEDSPRLQNAATMLRHQQAEIESLKKLLEHSVGSDCREMRYIQEIENKDAEIEALKKDLALKTRDRDVFKNFTLAYEERIAELEKCAEYYRDKYYFDSTAKTLTDEEIYQTWVEAKNTALNTKGNFVEVLFARAILRKAQER